MNHTKIQSLMKNDIPYSDDGSAGKRSQFAEPGSHPFRMADGHRSVRNRVSQDLSQRSNRVLHGKISSIDLVALKNREQVERIHEYLDADLNPVTTYEPISHVNAHPKWVQGLH